jgi:homoserine kinase
MYLELRVSITPPSASQQQSESTDSACKLSYSGVGASSIDLNPSNNLITRTALYVLRCHSIQDFPPTTNIHITNPIPLGRGLGSSGAAVVAGVLLGNLLLPTPLPRPRLLDFALMVERHPDNVAAALYGGFVGTYLNELDPVDMARKEVPLSEVLPQPAGGIDTGLTPPIPPVGIGHFRRFRWAGEIKAIAVVPDFEVSTAKARGVLPEVYSRKDMVGLLQLSLSLHVTARPDPAREINDMLTWVADLQPPTHSSPHHSPFRFTPRSATNLLRDARPDPSTLPRQSHPRSARHSLLNES